MQCYENCYYLLNCYLRKLVLLSLQKEFYLRRKKHHWKQHAFNFQVLRTTKGFLQKL